MKINQWNLIKYTITYKNKVNKVASRNHVPFQELMLVLTWTTELATHILK